MKRQKTTDESATSKRIILRAGMQKTEDFASMSSENDVFGLWRIFVDPVLKAFSHESCSSHCCQPEHGDNLLLEQLLVEKNCIPSPHPEIFGCPVHGTVRYAGANNPFAARYRAKFMIEMRRKGVDCAQKCYCDMIWLPRYYEGCSEFEWHPRPIYYCKSHLALHFCIQQTHNCNKCFCCLIKQPCLFRCHFFRADKKTGESICAISKITFTSDNTLLNVFMADLKELEKAPSAEPVDEKELEEQAAEENVPHALVIPKAVKKNPLRVADILKKQWGEWLVHARKCPPQASITIPTFFNLFYMSNMYRGTLQTKRRNVFATWGIPDFFKFVREYEKYNCVHVHWPENVDAEIMIVWGVITLYLPHFYTIHTLYGMISHLSKERGVCFANSGLLPINPTYLSCLEHLCICKPPVLQKVNLSQHINDFCVHLYNLTPKQQREIIDILRAKQLSLFAIDGS